jgi:hypothetical protein
MLKTLPAVLAGGQASNGVKPPTLAGAMCLTNTWMHWLDELSLYTCLTLKALRMFKQQQEFTA